MRRRAAERARRERIALALAVAAVAAATALLAAAPRVAAQSIFAAQGPGSPNAVAQPRSRVVGGYGFAVADSLRGSLLNPALAAHVHQVTFGLSLVPGMTKAEDPVTEKSWGQLSLSAVWLYLPTHRWCVAAGLRTERSTRGEILWQEEYAGSPVGRRFRRDGDHTAFPLALAREGAGQRWSAAIGVDFILASLVEDVSWSFTGTGFPGTLVKTRERLHGAAPTVSLALTPVEFATLGLIYRNSCTLHGDREVGQEAGTVERGRTEVEYPRRAGAGMTWRIRHMLLSGDVMWEEWGQFSRSGFGEGTDGPLDDAVSWGVGLERGGDGSRLPILGKRPLRAGFRRFGYPQRGYGDGSPVYEDIFSLGTGWTLGGGTAIFDFSLEGGWRGDLDHHGAREKLFQVALSLSGREPWKRPDRRDW